MKGSTLPALPLAVSLNVEQGLDMGDIQYIFTE